MSLSVKNTNANLQITTVSISMLLTQFLLVCREYTNEPMTCYYR